MATFYEPFLGSGALLLSMFDVEPFVKWVGGKRRLLGDISSVMPKVSYSKWVGADANNILMLAYNTLKVPDLAIRVVDLLKELDKFAGKEVKTSPFVYKGILETFNDLKMLCPHISVDDYNVTLVSMFIYLNYTGFNGLYRENRDGKYNVPFGKKTGIPYNLYDRILAMKEVNLPSVSFRVSDWTSILSLPKEGDFVYLDPPYEDTYASYTQARFCNQAHNLLIAKCFELHERGVRVLLSCADTELYRKSFTVLPFTLKEISATQTVSGNSKGRAKRKELLIYNYEAGK